MIEPLEQVLADMRGEAAVLRRHGDTRTADVLDGTVDRVKSAAEDFITWLSESDAHLRSGKAIPWLRSRYPEWSEAGHARLNARGQREYRLVVIPRRANISAAREAGRRGERRPS
ncbi:MAG: hypothetical protein H0U66_03115 [Gemmatimonadaceae bacterium]|nr:hypothetical protein [Gemmatimonadaceae bacterium]